MSVLLGCNNKEKYHSNKNSVNNKIFKSNKVLLDKDIESALKSYIKTKLKGNVIVMLFTYRDNCRPTFVLYELFELLETAQLPNSYAVVENIPVLIYSGSDYLFYTPSVKEELSTSKVPFVYKHQPLYEPDYKPSYIFLDESKKAVVYDTIIRNMCLRTDFLPK